MKNMASKLSLNEKALRISVDVVVFLLQEQKLCTVALGEQHFVESKVNTALDNNLEACAKRAVKEQLGVDLAFIEQVQTIGSAQKNAEDWVVSVVYYGLVAQNCFKAKQPSLDTSLKIVPLKEQATLVFHNPIIESCYQRLHNKALYTTLPIFLLADEFTLTEVQRAYEAVLGFSIEKKSFRRRILEAEVLQVTGNIRRASHRPALMYQLAELTPYYFSRVIQGGREAQAHMALL